MITSTRPPRPILRPVVGASSAISSASCIPSPSFSRRQSPRSYRQATMWRRRDAYDGSVYLRAYLPLAADHGFSAICAGHHGCGRVVEIGVHDAVAAAGPDCTAHAFARRLRCSACGERKVRLIVAYYRERRRPALAASTLAAATSSPSSSSSWSISLRLRSDEAPNRSCLSLASRSLATAERLSEVLERVARLVHVFSRGCLLNRLCQRHVAEQRSAVGIKLLFRARLASRSSYHDTKLLA